ncbi:MAG: hypothetical protein HZR80_04995 [Candidatus Heimdallarchaeota archaeon]
MSKSKNGLVTRLDDYKSVRVTGKSPRPKTPEEAFERGVTTTDFIINRNIHNLVKQTDDSVEIYILIPDKSLIGDYNGIEIDLVFSLEYPLIDYFNPSWNKKTRAGMKQRNKN